MNDDVVSLTQQLVRIPSLNPMGREVLGADYLEGRVTDFLQQWATDRGFAWERHSVLPGRDNLLMRLDGQGPARERTILLEVHQDTVPVEGMTIPPFAAERRDERIYGRGACDVKGGMAVMLTTLARLAHLPTSARPKIVLACTINEENGFDGVRHVCQLWANCQSRILPQPPDVAIVAEPTELDVVISHKGTVRWRCHTVGRAAHSSNPAAGDNAIYRMQPVLRALQQYADHLANYPEHPLLGRPTLSVGTIQGGLSVNTVPDRCTLEIDRRVLPDESPTDAYAGVGDFLNRRLGERAVVHDPPYLTSPGLPDGPNEALSTELSYWARQHSGRGQCRGVPFGTDAGALAAAGVPTVVFGPGSIEQAHTNDEWIAVEQLRQAVEVLTDFCRHDESTSGRES
jgi:acetylornithine deacetylase/succinyl-diaminopimelate desuccinylase-like protein